MKINCMHFVKRTLRPSFQFEQIHKKLFLILYSLCYFVVTKMSIFFHFNYFYTPRMMNIMHLSQRPIVSRITIIILPTLRT